MQQNNKTLTNRIQNDIRNNTKDTNMSAEQLIIPQRMQIESVFGCNARCTMCPVHMESKRKKGVMTFELFTSIIDQMEPYKESITKLDLWGLGEPLLDKNLPQKIAFAKQKGFKSIAIATNADLLNATIAKSLFDAGLDVVIFSIDGVQKKTQESIRVNTTFELVVANAEQAIAIRDAGEYKTRFVFRFISQEINQAEWPEYRDFWGQRIFRDKGDILIQYDMHTWGGEFNQNKQKTFLHTPDHVACHHVFDRLIVLYDGTVPLCCTDLHNADCALGHISKMSPIEAFNSSRAKEIRMLHKTGRRLEMELCKKCTILDSEQAQKVIS